MAFASLRASNARYVLVLALLSGLSVCQQGAFSAAALDPDDALGLCQTETIPKDIRSTLERRFGGWKVQDSNNLPAKTRQKWAAVAPLACPEIAVGHFEDSRSVSYALLLVPVERSANGYKFIVFSALSGQSFYGFKVLEQGTLNASAFFVHSVAIDRAFDSEVRKKFRPKGSEGILLNTVDERTDSEDVFFWTGESYDHARADL